MRRYELKPFILVWKEEIGPLSFVSMWIFKDNAQWSAVKSLGQK